MTIIIFIVILVLLIVVHEWGHLAAAKRAGVRVDEFGIGFPPRALTLFRRKGTAYTLNWLPLGGFVKIFGEDPEDVPAHHPDRARSLVGKPWYTQAFVLLAGVSMNIIAAWLLFSIAFMAGVPVSAEDRPSEYLTAERLTVMGVLTGSPAERAGMGPGDVIVGVRSDGDIVTDLTPQSVTEFVGRHLGDSVLLSLSRGGAAEELEVVPERNIVPDAPDRAALGISMGRIAELTLPPHLALYEAAVQTVEYTGAIAVALAGFLASAVTLHADFSQIAGPVGIVSLVGDAAELGLISLIVFTAVISLHLAIINLLPIPALDGGRLLFVLIEAVKGSPLPVSWARALNAAGFAVLILLMVVVTISDVLRLFIS